MVRSGLIVGGIMLLLVLGASLLTPFCSVCLAIPAGLLAGYLANVFERPGAGAASMAGPVARGAIAGAIAGALAILGQFIGAVINASSIDPAVLSRVFGVDNLTQQSLWLFQLLGAFCIGLLNLALMAGLGAAGALIWQQIQSRQAPPAPPVYPQ
jgi:hypothetical protein